MLGEVNSIAEREVYLGVVSRLSGVSVDTLTRDLGKAPAKEVEATEIVAPLKEDKTVKAGRFILNKILTHASFSDIGFLKKEWFTHPLHQSIFCDVVESAGGLKVATLFDKYTDDELNKIIGDDVVFEVPATEQIYYNDCILVLANDYISKQLDGLTKRYNASSTPADKKAIITQMASLQQKLKSKNVKDKI